MSGGDDDEEPGTFASPPCFLHELDPVYMGLSATGDPGTDDPRQHADVMRWRNAERERLIAERLAMDSDVKRAHDGRIAALLEDALGEVAGLTVSVYWPVLGEPDLRGVMERVTAHGRRCALPVAIEADRPCVFRVWVPDARLEPDIRNIPAPAKGDEVVPDVVIAPVVGFDRACYRLGYGGDFFGRTLAAMPTKPRVLGVGYAQAALPTIYPRPYDLAMDRVVTEDGDITRGLRDGEIRVP